MRSFWSFPKKPAASRSHTAGRSTATSLPISWPIYYNVISEPTGKKTVTRRWVVRHSSHHHTMLLPSPTDRLILRCWQDEDFPAFARMNADSRVMESSTASAGNSKRKGSDSTPSNVARTESCWVIRDFTGSRSTDRCTAGWKSAGDCAPKCGATGMPRKRPEAAFGTPACRKWNPLSLSPP